MTDEATPPAPPDPQSVGTDTSPASREPLEPGAQGALPPPSGLSPASPAGGGATPWRPNYAFLAVVSIVSLAADLGSKWWAKARLEDARFSDRRVEVIHDFFGFIFARNRGGAWGLLQDEPESIRRPFFLGISVLAIIFIVSLYRKLTEPQLALRWGLPLVLGGALGNLVNRIQFNYVVDFIDFQLRWGGREHHWPTFNVADIAIVAGVGLMAVDMFTSRRAPEARTPPPGAASTPGARELEAPFVPDAPVPGAAGPESPEALIPTAPDAAAPKET